MRGTGRATDAGDGLGCVGVWVSCVREARMREGGQGRGAGGGPGRADECGRREGRGGPGGRVQKKARLRKARRLLIVPFKTKVFLLKYI